MSWPPEGSRTDMTSTDMTGADTTSTDTTGTETTSKVAISTVGLVRRFGEFTAVDGVDLAIDEGEIYGFLGPNGAGKSTTVRMLCTLLAPTSGRAVVAGYDVGSQPGEVRLHIGVALQDAALDPKQ